MTEPWADVQEEHEIWLADGPDFDEEIVLIMTLEKDKAALLAVVKITRKEHMNYNPHCEICQALAALPEHLR